MNWRASRVSHVSRKPSTGASGLGRAAGMVLPAPPPPPPPPPAGGGGGKRPPPPPPPPPPLRGPPPPTPLSPAEGPPSHPTPPPGEREKRMAAGVTPPFAPGPRRVR